MDIIPVGSLTIRLSGEVLIWDKGAPEGDQKPLELVRNGRNTCARKNTSYRIIKLRNTLQKNRICNTNVCEWQGKNEL